MNNILNVYLIRHGQTQWNVERRLQGWGDSPLTELGIWQAQQAAIAMKSIPLTACYSSQLKRAQDTAQLIINQRDIPHFHHQGLNELHFGDWEGKKIADLQPLPNYQYFHNQPEKYQADLNCGENMIDFQSRIMSAFHQIIAQHTSGHILIVSHGLTLTMLLARLRQIQWQNFRDESQQAFIQNASINHLRIEKDAEQCQIQILEINQNQHLQP